MFGARTSSTSRNIELTFGASDVWAGYGTNGRITWSPYNITDRNIYETQKNLIYKNNTLIKTFSASTFTTPYTIPLFGMRDNSSTVTRRTKCRFYRFRIWENDTLLRDFIPCYDENNVVCLYDNVSGTYFYNQGTGDFIPGEIVTPHYTVTYDANGGTGSMSAQIINVNEYTNLTANTFTREHYNFAGWSTTSSGEVEYTDGQNVINLTSENETITLYAVWELIPYYTVAFNANGGTGTMTNQEIDTDVPTRLTLNSFTRDEYIFQGWTSSPSGTVIYSDGQEVTNITASGTTIILYAVWKKAPISLILQTNMSEKNKLDKDITNIETVYGTLRSECSIIDPVITFSADLNILKSCNYMTIPKFGRSYFVTNIRSIREGLVELTAHVDVLSSFKTQIRSNSAIIAKSENNWNLYLNDGSLKTYQNSVIYTKEFPSGFSTQSFVLAIAGS